jgi:flagellar biosynthesis/type III secretory pathway protein FliH
MRAMPYITSIERMGREEGLQAGRQEGLQAGRQEGLRKGREQGRELGRVESLREGILDVIEARFGQAPEGIRARVSAAEDTRRLKAWHRLAVTSATLREFELALEN